MSLVRWLRRNNTKIMAVVVIVLMIAFIADIGITRLGQIRRTGQYEAIAYFGKNSKITRLDLYQAQEELELLKMLRADVLLKSNDLRPLFLSELLFAEATTSPEIIGRIHQLVKLSGYRVSAKQINDIYRGSVPAGMYWLLLKKETEMAGFVVPKEEAGNLLTKVIPRLFEGATYPQLIGHIINQRRIPEDNILTTFGELLAVLQYASVVCANEGVTAHQIMHQAGFTEETIDVEFVKVDSSLFAKTADEPLQQQIEEHFNKYKEFLPGDVTDKNPYGFGYELDNIAELEYIAVKLDDVAKTITPPTNQEMEEYYQKHREQFTTTVKSDPNDPNSPSVERTRSYAEVASTIAKGLLQNKINSKAESILREAKELTETGLQNISTEPTKLTSDQFKQLAGNYETAANQLSEKNKIKIYAGKTGPLSAVEMQADKYLSMLYIRSRGSSPVRLTQIVFAADELGTSELSPFDTPKPRLYENIGPLRDIFGQVMMLVRIIHAQKSSEPESINQTISRIPFEFDKEQKTSRTYSIKEKVAEDLKKLAAMDTTRIKAEQFISVAKKDGWDNAVKKFNDLYRPKNTQDPNAFKLQNQKGLQRISKAIMEALAVQNAGDPMSSSIINESKKQGRLIEQLYSLLPPDSNTVGTLPVILEFKPEMSYYCLKNLSVKHLTQEEYEKLKAMQILRQDFLQAQSLAPVLFNPQNILKRTGFRWAEPQKKSADTNTPVESERNP